MGSAGRLTILLPPLLRSICILALTLTAGCSATAKNIEAGPETVAAVASEALVFGRVEWIEAGEAKEFGDGMFSRQMNPNLVRMQDKTRITGAVSKTGTFAWSLAPGTYMINKIRYRDPWSGEYFVVPKAAFDVPDSGGIYYVGTLRADFEGKRDIIGGLGGDVVFSVRDDFDTAWARMGEELGAERDEAEKSLMVQDERLPRTIDTTEGFNLAMSILNAVLYGMSQ